MVLPESFIKALNPIESFPAPIDGRKFLISLILRFDSSTTVTSFVPLNHSTLSDSPEKCGFLKWFRAAVKQ